MLIQVFHPLDSIAFLYFNLHLYQSSFQQFIIFTICYEQISGIAFGINLWNHAFNYASCYYYAPIKLNRSQYFIRLLFSFNYILYLILIKFPIHPINLNLIPQFHYFTLFLQYKSSFQQFIIITIKLNQSQYFIRLRFNFNLILNSNHLLNLNQDRQKFINYFFLKSKFNHQAV